MLDRTSHLRQAIAKAITDETRARLAYCQALTANGTDAQLAELAYDWEDARDYLNYLTNRPTNQEN